MKKFLMIALSVVVALASCNKDDGTLDGRWDAPRSEEMPDDLIYTFVFSGNTLDLYVHSYGWHCTGTYTYENNLIKYSINDIQQSLTDVDFDNDGHLISWAGGMGSMNSSTLQPSEGYQWYALGLNRSDLLEEYKDNYSQFSFKKTSSTTADCGIMGPADSFKFTKVK